MNHAFHRRVVSGCPVANGATAGSFAHLSASLDGDLCTTCRHREGCVAAGRLADGDRRPVVAAGRLSAVIELTACSVRCLQRFAFTLYGPMLVGAGTGHSLDLAGLCRRNELTPRDVADSYSPELERIFRPLFVGYDYVPAVDDRLFDPLAPLVTIDRIVLLDEARGRVGEAIGAVAQAMGRSCVVALTAAPLGNGETANGLLVEGRLDERAPDPLRQAALARLIAGYQRAGFAMLDPGRQVMFSIFDAGS